MAETNSTNATNTSQMLPDGNTGALRTDSAPFSLGGNVGLDWLRVRLPDCQETWLALTEYFGVCVNQPGGWRSWYTRRGAILDGGIIAWCDSPERAEVQGVLVDLNGASVACMGGAVLDFLAWALGHDGRVTRADFAIDDHSGLLTRERIVSAYDAGEMVATSQSLEEIQNRKHGLADGWTVYIGNRKSESYFRFYDKRAQTKTQGGAWVRCEWETKSKLADALCRQVLERGGDVILEQVNRRIRFCERVETDSNKRRWPLAQWWREFIGNTTRGASILVGEPIVATISKAKFWLERGWARWLGAITEAEGGDLTWLYDVIERGARKLQPRHQAAIGAAWAMAAG